MFSSKWALIRVVLNNDGFPHIYWNRVFNNKWLVALSALEVVIHPARLASHSLDGIYEIILPQVLTAALILRSMQRPPRILLAGEFLVGDLWGVEFEDLIRWPNSIRVVIVWGVRHLQLRRCATSPSNQVVLKELCDNGRLIFSALKILLVQWIVQISLLLINYLTFKLVYKICRVEDLNERNEVLLNLVMRVYEDRFLVNDILDDTSESLKDSGLW